MALLGKWASSGQSDALTGEALERLLANMRKERQRVEAAVETLNGCRTDIPDMQTTLGAASQRTAELAGRLDDLSSRIDNVGRSTQVVHDLEKRLNGLEQTLLKAEARADEAARQAAAVQDQRESIEQLVSLAAGAQALMSDVKRDSPEIERLAEQLQTLRAGYEHMQQQQQGLQERFDRLTTTGTTLSDEAAAARDACQDAQARAGDAVRTIAEVEEKLDAISQSESVRRDTSAELQALNALAEHVASKVKALELQHQTIERALVETRRLNEMVWSMDVQIAKLNEGSTLAGRVEENLARLERLHQDTTLQADDAARTQADLSSTLDQHRREASELLQVIQAQVDRLALNRKEMETLGERLTMAQTVLADMERRLDAVTTNDETVRSLGEKTDALAQRFGGLAAQAQSLEGKQAVLTTVEQRLDQVEALAKRADWQLESLLEHRREVEHLKSAFQEFDSVYGRARALTDGLRAEKQELAQLVDRTTSFMRELPATAAAIEKVQAAVNEVEATASRAADMKPTIDELAGDIERLTPRLGTVEEVQSRLRELHAVSAEVDTNLAAQLARRAEIDGVRIACDGLSSRLSEAQHTFEALAAAQARLVPVPDQLARLEADLRTMGDRVGAVLRDEESLAAQERRLETLKESAGALAHELAGRIESLRGLQDELAAASTVKEQLCAELADLKALHRETFATTREAEDHLQQLAAHRQQIAERRAEVEIAERTVAAVERRLNELEHTSNSLDAKIEAVAARERIVDAVKHEVETIHAVARKVQDDLAATAEGHAQIAQGRAEVQRLREAISEITAKIGDVEARGGAIDDVRRRCDAVIRLLDDMRITLDTVGEQKAMVDHVAENLARLDDVISEARGTTKALQAERKLAQRIVENIRSVHARAGADIRQVG
jgi:chromosome segregation ATPase